MQRHLVERAQRGDHDSRTSSISIYVSISPGPLVDGTYAGEVNVVTGTADYTVAAQVTFKSGLTAGTFAGTTAGSSPVEIGGSFTC